MKQSVGVHHSELQKVWFPVSDCSQSSREPRCTAGLYLFFVYFCYLNEHVLMSVNCVQQEALPTGWVEELPVDYDVYVDKDADPDALRLIHLYRVL